MSLSDLSTVPTWVHDAETLIILQANAAATRWLGYSESEICGMNLNQIYVDAQGAFPIGASQNVTLDFRTKDARTVTALVSCAPSNHEGKAAYLVQMTDVTELRMENQRLSLEAERYRTALEATTDVLWDWNFITNEVFRAGDIYRTFGYIPEAVGKDSSWWQNCLHPDDLPRVTEKFWLAVHGSEDVWTDEYRFRRADGSYATILDRARIRRDEWGKAISMVGTMLDVSARREAEIERDQVFATSLDIIIIVNFEGKLVRFNPAFTRILGWTAEDVLGKRLSHLVHPEDNVGVEQRYSQFRAGESLVQFESRMLNAAGEYVTLEWNVKPDVERGYYCVGRDVTESKRRQLELIASKARIETILERATDAYLAANGNWIVTRTNSKAAPILRELGQNLVGRPMWDAFPGAESGDFGLCAREVVEKGVSCEIVTYFRALDAYIETHMYPFEDGICIFFRDVTLKHRSQEALKKTAAELREAQAIASIGSWAINLETDEVFWSDQVYDLFGFAKGEFVPTRASMMERIYSQDREGVSQALVDSLESGGTLDIEFRIYHTDSRVRYLHAIGRLDRDEHGEAYQLVGTFQDITKRKLVELELAARQAELRRIFAINLDLLAELRTKNTELEDRVRDRTRELESFSYSVAHDIRAPLRGIDGFSQILETEYGPKLDDDARSYIARVRQQTARISHLIDDLLSLSRITRKELELSSIDMSKLASEIIDELRSREPQRPCEITIEPEMTATGDRAMVRLLLDNLIGNAWKFSSQKGAVKIEVFSDKSHEPPIFAVRDEGAGFDKAYIHMLFEAFQRLHSNQEFSGTGIGLAIAQRVAKRHGGEIWAESEIGEGATFYFTLN